VKIARKENSRKCLKIRIRVNLQGMEFEMKSIIKFAMNRISMERGWNLQVMHFAKMRMPIA